MTSILPSTQLLNHHQHHHALLLTSIPALSVVVSPGGVIPLGEARRGTAKYQGHHNHRHQLYHPMTRLLTSKQSRDQPQQQQ
mmetsp:Transcript_15874/g.32946  ORF Transcript_15874/g.32946 Transcript_15874/m.32946 type:complete len:82 (+) Transcript_15874:158-403(+)